MVLRWVGGKQLLLNHLLKKLPRFTHYYEPFLGGGSVFNEIQRNHRNKVYYLNDANFLLVNFYIIIQQELNSFKEKLLHEINIYENHKDQRELFNLYVTNLNTRHCSFLDLSVYFYLFNRLCFNGLFRVNKKGLINSSWGKKKEVYYNLKDFEDLHNSLQGAFLSNLNYKDFLEKCIPESLIYLDPPYLTDFNSYTKSTFDEDQHIRLFLALNRAKYNWILSVNNDPLFLDLYKKFKIETIETNQAINNSKRTDLIIRNF